MSETFDCVCRICGEHYEGSVPSSVCYRAMCNGAALSVAVKRDKGRAALRAAEARVVEAAINEEVARMAGLNAETGGWSKDLALLRNYRGATTELRESVTALRALRALKGGD
jgi:hypothetical protein